MALIIPSYTVNTDANGRVTSTSSAGGGVVPQSITVGSTYTNPNIQQLNAIRTGAVAPTLASTPVQITNLPLNPNQPVQITDLPYNPNQPARVTNYSSSPYGGTTGTKTAYYTSDVDLQNALKYLGNQGINYVKWTPGTQIGAGSLALGGSGVIPDSALSGGTRLGGADRYETAAAMQAYAPTLQLSNIQAALNAQTSAQTGLYNQQASDQAAKIRQAIARQTQQGEATKTDYTNQMNTAINTLNTERAKIPGQITNLNNQASSTGMVNAQHIRNALAQMGLLQSGESASQQLLNDTTVQNNINANNLQGQQLDASYGDKIASAQTDLASKVKAINDAIALAQAQGDENALLALQDAQAKIANAAAQGAVDYNNWAYKVGRDAIGDRQWQQGFDANQIQQGIDNAYRQYQATTQNSQWQQGFNADQAYRAAQIAAAQQPRAYTPTATEQKNNAYGDAYDRIAQLFTEGVSPADIMNEIRNNEGTFRRAGVNPQDLYDYLSRLSNAASGQRYQAGGYQPQ